MQVNAAVEKSLSPEIKKSGKRKRKTPVSEFGREVFVARVFLPSG